MKTTLLQQLPRVLLPLSIAALAFAEQPAVPPEVVPAPVSAAADPALVRAVRERRVITFTYAGHARVVEPHAYGVAATGETILHGFQTDGGSVSGNLPGWRTFEASLVRELAVTDATFARARADYAAGRPKLAPLWADVAAPVSASADPSAASAP